MGPSTTRQSAKQAGTVVLAVRVALVGSALALAFLPLPRPFVESVYARRLYPLIRQLVTSVTRHVDVALFDLLLGGGVLVISAWWAVRMLRAPRGRRVREIARLSGLTVVFAAA
jgi:hypothetical protein